MAVRAIAYVALVVVLFIAIYYASLRIWFKYQNKKEERQHEKEMRRIERDEKIVEKVEEDRWDRE